MKRGLTVVVPVFNAAEQTRRCLTALQTTLNSLQHDVQLLIIDDASTSQQIPALLEEFERAQPRWTILRQSLNQGFVRTANLGLHEAGDTDVLLLNSDTVPAGEWLARILKCAETNPNAASITPFTNNGEIASLGALCCADPVPENPELWADACQRIQPPSYPELPTAVGFCMYLRRQCLDQIGDFDAKLFGLGYGEENDWCFRASAAGWKHVLCDDAFVAHEGNASFGPLGLKPSADSMQRLQSRHPNYSDVIQDFIKRDPLGPIRARILQSIAKD